MLIKVRLMWKRGVLIKPLKKMNFYIFYYQILSCKTFCHNKMIHHLEQKLRHLSIHHSQTKNMQIKDKILVFILSCHISLISLKQKFRRKILHFAYFHFNRYLNLSKKVVVFQRFVFVFVLIFFCFSRKERWHARFYEEISLPLSVLVSHCKI